MKKFKLILREIGNYLYIRKVLNAESKKGPGSNWEKYKLRKNWYGRTYTVVSLREEDMGEEEMVRNWKAMEMMRPINDYMSSLDLQEIVFPSIEKIPDSRSYLVVYSPLFKEFTASWLIARIIYVIALCLGVIFSIKLIF